MQNGQFTVKESYNRILTKEEKRELTQLINLCLSELFLTYTYIDTFIKLCDYSQKYFEEMKISRNYYDTTYNALREAIIMKISKIFFEENALSHLLNLSDKLPFSKDDIKERRKIRAWKDKNYNHYCKNLRCSEVAHFDKDFLMSIENKDTAIWAEKLCEIVVSTHSFLRKIRNEYLSDFDGVPTQSRAQLADVLAALKFNCPPNIDEFPTDLENTLLKLKSLD